MYSIAFYETTLKATLNNGINNRTTHNVIHVMQLQYNYDLQIFDTVYMFALVHKTCHLPKTCFHPNI